MKTNKISPDDPRLTTYALNEMEADEQAGFVALLQDDPAAQAAVEEIRATARALGAALEAEPVPVLPPASSAPAAPPVRGKLLRFPQLYFMVSSLAAACFAVFFLYWEQHRPAPEQKRYVEMAAAKPVNANADQEEKEEKDSPVTAPLPLLVETPPTPSPDAARSEIAGKSLREEPVEVSVPVPAPAPLPPALQVTTNASLPVPEKKEGNVARLDEVDKTIVLSPFTVEASADQGYAANSTLAGTRVRSPLAALVGSEASSIGSRDAATGSDEFKRNYRDEDVIPPVGSGGLTPLSDFNTETYAPLEENKFLAVAQDPLSTFSIDVDTGAYANVRRFLEQKQRPPRDAVRIEEMVNYFPYHYAPPPAGGAPFAASLEVASAPWAPAHRLVRIGLKGRVVSEAERPAASLVFLIDVSGSMEAANKLPLVKESMRLLVARLRPDDRVAIVTYAGESGVALRSTTVKKKAGILKAIDRLEAGGSTNGGAGIQLAYDLARENLVPGGINRVILATDGDFNVGVTAEGELTRLIEQEARSGVSLTVLGFGMGNYKDAMLVKLSDKGNGNYAYIDTAAEARKALVDQVGGTLLTIAKDVKIQVEFNPAQVQSYRLIGYEKRALRKEDFNDDRVDAGEIGSGHTVTALYEVVPVGAGGPATGSVDPLKYQNGRDADFKAASDSDELLTVKIRYKEPSGDVSRKLEFPLRDAGRRFEEASADFKFSAAVAAFGMILRESPFRGDATLTSVAAWARSGLEDDAGGYRGEFLELVGLAGETAP
jgi:Ca-activated chloride channel family protein